MHLPPKLLLSTHFQLLPLFDKPVSDLRELGVWPADTKFFIHLCSGLRRNGDLIHPVEKSCAEIGVNVVGLAVDPLAQFGFPDVPKCPVAPPIVWSPPP